MDKHNCYENIDCLSIEIKIASEILIYTNIVLQIPLKKQNDNFHNEHECLLIKTKV